MPAVSVIVFIRLVRSAAQQEIILLVPAGGVGQAYNCIDARAYRASDHAAQPEPA